MQEALENRTVTLVIKTGKLTGRTLYNAISKLLRYSKNKVKEHKSVKPQGKQSVKKLIAQNQGVESAEIADKEEARLFDRAAKKYGVDYAIRKGVSEKGEPRYILFFKARDRKAIDQALASYTKSWDEQSKQNRPSLRKTLEQLSEKLPGKAKTKEKEIVR